MENAPSTYAQSTAGYPGHKANWHEALTTLIASRTALIRLEGGDCVRRGARRLARILAAAVCLCFGWILLWAGGIAAVASASGWPWHWLAIAAGAFHLLVALGLARMAKPGPPAFPLTFAEFQKDREWIENLHKTPKSNV